MSASHDADILNIDEAAALLGVSAKTFNKVLHSEDIPARKIGREWRFSRIALIEWVGRGRSSDYYRDDRARLNQPPGSLNSARSLSANSRATGGDQRRTDPLKP